jgi:diguanylate cyclase (GGDEF)-like protein
MSPATFAPTLAAGRPLAVTLLVVGLVALTVLMVWAVGRGGRRERAGSGRSPRPWEGVDRAVVTSRSAERDLEQRPALCEAARGVAHADGAQVWELDPEGDLVATDVAGTPPRERRLRVPAGLKPELRDEWGSGSGELLGAVQSGVLAATGALQVHLESMVVTGRLVGFLAVDWRAYAAAPAGDVRSVLALLAAQAALVTERGELQRSARTDALTGLPNRGAFEDSLRREMSRAQRLSTPLTVALLDLDGFKQLNDTAGHAAGDAALRAAADAWTHALRSIDVLARYGGDEFAVLLPNCDLAQAEEVLDRMRASTPTGLGASIGVTEWHSRETPEELVGRADTALYASKRAGRNRTTAFEPGTGDDDTRVLRRVG